MSIYESSPLVILHGRSHDGRLAFNEASSGGCTLDSSSRK